MTLNEIRETIAESPNKDWFQKYAVKLNFPQINFSLTLEGVPAIYEFVQQQIEGYNTYQKLPSDLENVKKTFVNVRSNIIALMKGNIVQPHTWNSNLNALIANSPKIFLYNSPETLFLISVHENSPEYYSGVYEYLIGTTQNSTNKNHLVGYIMAFEFSSKDFSTLVERTESEKKSISAIRVEFQKELNEAQKHLTEYLSQANQKYIEYSAKIDQFKEEREGAYEGWFGKTSVAYAQFYSESQKKIKDLEKLYQEKLKLEAPAKYWTERAKKLRSEGYKWLSGLVLLTILSIGILIWTLNEISTGTIEKIFQNTGTAIKWSVIYITLISFLAFAIRIFSKLTFSSFHLVRDAEEREQLTYVYLALQKEKGIDQTERHLIMQSLFSRADSGLLKEDASPTMPGNIVDKMITK